jgi:hypothetical protein
MGFELQVKLTGLCMFGIQPNTKSIIVVMPDTRFRTDAAGAEVPMRHPDGNDAKAHVGYLRFNLANLNPSIQNVPPSNITTAPPYEVIHRFDCEDLDFGLTDNGEDITATQDLRLPDFDDFAPVIEGIPTVFDMANKRPPSQTLMRTVLRGGRVRSVGEGEKWYITGELHPDGQRRDSRYDGDIEWRRWVDADQLTLTIKSLNRAVKPVVITLKPRSFGGPTPTIPLKIANLCSTNPMEWDELELRRVREADVDFKWFYQLVQLKPGENSIQYPASVVPHPQPVVESEAKEGILTDCFPSRLTISSPVTSAMRKDVRTRKKQETPVATSKAKSAAKKKRPSARPKKR